MDSQHTTYVLGVDLKAAARNVYTLFGEGGHPLTLPPAVQFKRPLGADIGGVDPMFFAFKPESQFDSWLTIGITEGDSSNKISMVGLDFKQWTAERGLSATNGAIFYMNPSGGPGKGSRVSGCCTKNGAIVVAQLTVKKGFQGSVKMSVGGRSATGSDWRQRGVTFKLGK